MKNNKQTPLSEKKHNANFLDEPDKFEWAFKEKDVAEAVEKLKDSLCLQNLKDGCNDCLICNEINKIFGSFVEEKK